MAVAKTWLVAHKMAVGTDVTGDVPSVEQALWLCAY